MGADEPNIRRNPWAHRQVVHGLMTEFAMTILLRHLPYVVTPLILAILMPIGAAECWARQSGGDTVVPVDSDPGEEVLIVEVRRPLPVVNFQHLTASVVTQALGTQFQWGSQALTAEEVVPGAWALRLVGAGLDPAGVSLGAVAQAAAWSLDGFAPLPANTSPLVGVQRRLVAGWMNAPNVSGWDPIWLTTMDVHPAGTEPIRVTSAMIAGLHASLEEALQLGDAFYYHFGPGDGPPPYSGNHWNECTRACHDDLRDCVTGAENIHTAATAACYTVALSGIAGCLLAPFPANLVCLACVAIVLDGCLLVANTIYDDMHRACMSNFMACMRGCGVIIIAH